MYYFIIRLLVLPLMTRRVDLWSASSKLALDGWMTVFSSDEDVRPVDFGIFVLDHTGQSHTYARPDGMSHEQLLEVRREQDTRKVVMFMTWPHGFKLLLPEKLRQAKGATKEKVQTLLHGHAEHVSFGECKDDQGNTMHKTLMVWCTPGSDRSS